MPALLVHGNPDSSILWDGVIAYFDKPNDIIAVDLPGFAAPKQEGFEATKEGYTDWLVDRLEELNEAGGPVDLVGHDWGSLLVQHIAAVRPDLLRTLACGGAAVDREYPWHEIAQVWQTPEEGERYMREDLTDEVAVPYLVEHGVPEEYARRNSWTVAGNKDVILSLYRSAIDIGAEWQAGVEQVDLPSMVIWGRGDPYVPLEPWGTRLAERLQAELVVLDCGHWWPFERPRETARALQRLWSGADDD